MAELRKANTDYTYFFTLTVAGRRQDMLRTFMVVLQQCMPVITTRSFADTGRRPVGYWSLGTAERLSVVTLRDILILPHGKVMVNDSELVGVLAEVQDLENSALGAIKMILRRARSKKMGIPFNYSPSISGPSVTESATEAALEFGIESALLDQVKKANTLLIELLGDKITASQSQQLDLLKILGIENMDLK